eukprot:scaffold173176_cov31-Tisochrysis_lutea.AAC.1
MREDSLRLRDDLGVEEVLEQSKGSVPVGRVGVGELDAHIKQTQNPCPFGTRPVGLCTKKKAVEEDAHREVERALLVRIEWLGGGGWRAEGRDYRFHQRLASQPASTQRVLEHPLHALTRGGK